MHNEIKLQEVTDKRLLKEYIYLPAKLYKSYSNWVPPIYDDEWKFHHPQKNSAYAFADTKKWIAYKNDVAVGRIMGIIHHKYNTDHNLKDVRFFQLDCIDDAEVCNTLINVVEDWGRENGMQQIIGPYGFSEKDPQGSLIEGFEYLPVIAAPTNPPYYEKYFNAKGFVKKMDCVSYQMPIPEKLPPLHERIYSRVIKNKSIHLLEFKSKLKLKPWIVPVFRLVNETYADLFGFTPMSEPEMKKMAAQYLPVLDPAFVKVITNEQHEVIAFIVAMPDMSVGIQKAKGKILPFGFIHMLRSAKKTKQLDLLLGAVKQQYRGLGLDVLLGAALINDGIKRGLEYMDSHLVLETNKSMCSECTRVGGKVYKRFRVFTKDL